MNRILDFNEELGHITLEPGVTQRQLYDFLQVNKSNLWMDATGSTETHSIIGILQSVVSVIRPTVIILTT